MTVATDMTCDLLVAGSGAGGLATAVVAARLGLDVVLIEKEAVLGGTTAWSGGWMWAPRNPLAVEGGIVEDIEAPREYLRNELGNAYDPAKVDMFLNICPAMVDWFRANTAMAFIDGNLIPDFHETPGAAKGGRSVCAAPFDGRKLGRRIRDLRPPLRDIAPFGMGIAAGADVRHFLNATYGWASFRHVAGRMLRHFRDLARHGRGMHLVAGNALVARLLKSADDAGVRILTSAPARGLMVESGAVIGAQVAINGRERAIRARRGVVLACGGFPHDVARIAQLYPHAPTGREHHSAAPLANTGDGIRMGETIGADVTTEFPHAGAWAPVSLTPRRDGTSGRFPHLIERAKPGLIAVRADGRRFTNEADAYHDVMSALFAATPPGAAHVAWLVCDHAFQRRYGLGHAKPRPYPVQHQIASGYLKRGRTLAELANACGIDPAGFLATVAAYNTHARQGRDPEFHRGESAYNRVQGDARVTPNPCVAPIEHGPFYAVRIVPGSLGSFAGLRTDEHARVLNASRAPIPGLYAVGNDMGSMMGGAYPAGGITLGPAMTFAFVAAHHIAGAPLPSSSFRKHETNHATI